MGHGGTSGGPVSPFDGQVTVNADDGLSTSTGIFDGNNIRIGQNGGNTRDSFFRFLDVQIPQAATIDVAFVTVSGDENSSAAVKTQIHAEDADDAVAPTTAAEHAADVRTTAFTTWDDEAVLIDVDVNSPSIVTVIQEIVDRGSWVPGNALMILVDDNGSAGGNQHFWNDFNNDSTRAMQLHVEFS